MKQKIYGIFDNIVDAKQAFGSIKKESLNQTDLTIVFADQEAAVNRRKTDFEFAVEDYSEPPCSPSCSWSGLKTENLPGIGRIQIGSNNPDKLVDSAGQPGSIQLAAEDLGVIRREIKANKIVTIIEAESELLPKLRLILESNGAEIINE